MTDHYRLDVDPDGVMAVHRSWAALSHHLDTKGRQARRTPGDIGDEWSGGAASTIKGDMGVLGTQMIGYSRHFADAAESLKTLAHHYRHGLHELHRLNARHATAIADFHAAQKKIAHQEKHDKAQPDYQPPSPGKPDPYRHGRQRASGARDRTIGGLDDEYDDLVDRMRRATTRAAQHIAKAVGSRVDPGQLKHFRATGDYPRIDLDSTTGRKFETLRLKVASSRPAAPDPTVKPTRNPLNGKDLDPGSAGVEYAKGGDGPLEVSGDLTRSTSDVDVDEDGVEYQTTKVTGTLQVTASADAEVGHLKASLSAYAGKQLSYSYTLPTGLRGDPGSKAPDPAKPWTIPADGSLTIDKDSYTGLEGDLGVDLVGKDDGGHRGEGPVKGPDTTLATVGASDEMSKGTETGIKRLDGTHVRVYVGPHDAVSQALKATLGNDTLSLSASLSRTSQNYKLHQVDLDISTKAGYDAYLKMVMGHQIPPAGARGVSNAATINGFKSTSSTDIELKALKAHLGKDFETVDDAQEIHYADGSREILFTTSGGTVNMVNSVRFDPDGKVVDEAHHLILQDCTPATIRNFNEIYAHTPNYTVDGNANVVITMTPDDVKRLREGALQQLATNPNIVNPHARDAAFGKHATPADVEAWLKANPGKVPPGIQPDDPAWLLVSTKRPEYDLPRLLGNYGDPADTHGGDKVVSGLTGWQMANQSATHDFAPRGPGSTVSTYTK